jgi:hypothetical protein
MLSCLRVGGNLCSDGHEHEGSCVVLDSQGYNKDCDNSNGFLVTEVCEEAYGTSFNDVTSPR